MAKGKKSDLETIFDNQSDLQILLSGTYFKPFQDYNLVRLHALGVMAELGEFLEADKEWKNWDNSNKAKNIGEAKLELIDTFMFVINLIMAYGIDYKEFTKLYNKNAQKLNERHGIEYDKI